MTTIGTTLNSIEMDLEKEMKKFQQKKNNGVSSRKKNRVENKEIKNMGKIMQHDSFQNDPLGTLKMHITNNLSI